MSERYWLVGIAVVAACGSVNSSDDGEDDGADGEDDDGADGGDDGVEPGFRRVFVDVTGLRGTMVLQNSGGDDLTITADGEHRFETDVQEGAEYAVTVLSDPQLQNCHVAAGSGTIADADVRLAVGCYQNIFMWIDDNPDPNQYNHELWMSDGTAEGTGRSVNINQDEAAGTGPSDITRYQDLFYLVANDGSGPALWRTDGTQAGTSELRVFDTISLGSGALVHEGSLYFIADGDAAGTELWRYTGSTFTRLTDINPGDASAFFNGPAFAVLGNKLLFEARDATSSDDPWSYDLTTGTAQLLRDIIPGAFTGQATDPIVVGNRAVFRADHDTAGLELWVTDGTPLGTDLLEDINPTTGASIEFLYWDGNVVYFRANDGTNGRELWKTDGTGTGTVLVRNIAFGNMSSEPRSMVAFAGKLWFIATDENGDELWSTDGTADGTQKLEVNPSESIGSNPIRLEVVGDRLYFVANGGDGAGQELWVTDGTAEGTARISDTVAGPGDGAGDIGPYDGRVLYFFNASYDTTELWSTDGTAAGTQKVKDICAEPQCNPYAQFVRITD